MIAIDNQLNNHYLTQITLEDLMLLTKHKLNTKPQDKSFCLHVRGCGRPPQLILSFVDSSSVSSSFFLLSSEKPLSSMIVQQELCTMPEVDKFALFSCEFLLYVSCLSPCLLCIRQFNYSLIQEFLGLLSISTKTISYF